MEEVIAANLAVVRGRIDAAARAAGRASDSVTLVAVGKTHGADAIRAALAAGQRVFGENRVQEALGKFPGAARRFSRSGAASDRPVADQQGQGGGRPFRRDRNRRPAAAGEALAREMARTGRRLPCFIEVNTGEEPQKSGVHPGAADAFIADCRDRLGLPIVGLMCVPPHDEEPSPHFALLREIARRNGLAGLSMGMSADYEIAIRFGATHVRVGTAIFGARQAYPVAAK